MNTPPFQNSDPTRLSLLSADAIDTGGPWLFWSALPDDILIRSLKERGQIIPVLIDTSGHVPALVAGAGQVAALKQMKRDVLCLDIGPLSDLDKGLAYLHAHLGRSLKDGQIVAALRYFQARQALAVDAVWTALNLEPRSGRGRLVQAWLTLPEIWDAALNDDRIPLACAEFLAVLPPADTEALLPLFTHLSWSRGNAVNLCAWVREIALRDGSNVTSVLAACSANDMLTTTLSPKDAMSRLVQAVRLLRYPCLSSLERAFAETARQLEAGTHWRLCRADHFETPAVDISIRVNNLADLQRASEELSRMAKSDVAKELFMAEKS